MFPDQNEGNLCGHRNLRWHKTYTVCIYSVCSLGQDHWVFFPDLRAILFKTATQYRIFFHVQNEYIHGEKGRKDLYEERELQENLLSD